MRKLKSISWEGSKSAIEGARRELPPLAQEYFQAGRKAAGTKTSAKELHRFRLATKRFRYTLELFRPLYGPGLESRLRSLRQIQQQLGDINDCATTRKLLATGQTQPVQVKKVLALIGSEQQEKTQAFLQYWREKFDAPGQERGWTQYLQNFAGRKGRARRS